MLPQLQTQIDAVAREVRYSAKPPYTMAQVKNELKNFPDTPKSLSKAILKKLVDAAGLK